MCVLQRKGHQHLPQHHAALGGSGRGPGPHRHLLADQKYTWDMKENDNLDWQFPARPSHRFDRVYLLPERSQGAGLRIPPSPSGTEEDQRFALVGKVRLSKCKYSILR